MRAWPRDAARAHPEQGDRLMPEQFDLIVLGAVTGAPPCGDPHTGRVADRELPAGKILIATGSRTAIPPIPGLEDVDWLDHVNALELDEIPEALLVVGAGPVGLEFAQIFARFGS